MDKLSDLKDLIKKKQDCCTVGKVYRIVSVVMRGEFHEGLNSDCHTILIYKNTVLTEEQIKANHYFFLKDTILMLILSYDNLKKTRDKKAHAWNINWHVANRLCKFTLIFIIN